MKASKSMTTLAAAAMVSVLGLAYAQSSETGADPSVNPQNRPITLGDQQTTVPLTSPADPSTYVVAEPVQPAQPMQADAQPASDTTMTASGTPADTSAPPAAMAEQPAATPAPTDSTSTAATPSYTAPAPSDNPDSAPIVERAPRADRN